MSNYYDTDEGKEKKEAFELRREEQGEVVEESRQCTCPSHFDPTLLGKDTEEVVYPEKRARCPIYFNPALIEEDINKVMYPEKRARCPIFFWGEDEAENAIVNECVAKGKDIKETFHEIIKAEAEKEKSMSPISLDDSHRKNTDKGHDSAEKYEELQEPLIEASTSVSKDMKDEPKANETLLTTSENGYQENTCVDQKDKKIMRRLQYIAAKVYETGEVSQIQHESEEDAGSIILTKGAAEKLFGCSAYGLIHGGIERRQFDELPKKNKKEKPKAISNFEVIPVKVICYLDRAGQENGDGKIICNIIINDRLRRLEKTFGMDLRGTGNLTGYILKKYPMAIIYEPKRKNERMIENDFRSRVSEATEKVCYVNAGWNQVDGKQVYIYKNIRRQDIMTNTQLNLPVDYQIRPSDISNFFAKILTLYDDKKTLYALLTYSCLGIFYKVFDDAGWPPHFLMFMYGASGSMKTSIAKVLYTQLCYDEHRKYPRRLDTDSETSMERGLILAGRDTVTLFDDYAPAKTVQKGNEAKNRLEMLIRIAGDGSTKSRSNINLEDRRGEGLKGMIVVTGELKGTGLSSNLRCLYCEIKKEYVNTSTLLWLQKNERIYTTILYHMTIFISSQWNFLIQHIQSHYEEYRKEAYKKINVNRMVDMLVTLWVITDMIGIFFRDYCGSMWSDEWILHVKQELQNLVIVNEELSVEDDPVEVFMQALSTLINNNQIVMVQSDNREEILQKADGYETEEYYYLLPEKAYEKVKDRLRKGGKEFSLDVSETIKMLYGSGCIHATSNGSEKKTYYSRIKIGEKRIKLMKISKRVIAKQLERDGV